MTTRWKCFGWRIASEQEDTKVETPNDAEVQEILDAIKRVKVKQTKEPSKNCQNRAGLSELKKFKEKYKDRVNIADRLRKGRDYNEDSHDTLLHAAALYNDDDEVIKMLMTCCPDLINIPRTGRYEGQTALHITLSRGKIKLSEAILNSTKNERDVLSAKARGSKFKKTIMLGETVLSVAVLSLDKDLVDLLLGYRAPLDEVNRKGDTVVHSLIRYAALDTSNIPKVIAMLKHLHDRGFKILQGEHESLHKLWFKENNMKLTPLKLAVKKGLFDLVKTMLKMKKVFCFNLPLSGSLDSTYYDITEIDPETQSLYSKKEEEKSYSFQHSHETKSVTCFQRLRSYFIQPQSVVEMMSTLKFTQVQQLIDIQIIKLVITKRWKNCKKLYKAFIVLHLIAIILLTTSAYYRKYIVHTQKCMNTKTDCAIQELYAYVVPWILMVYGLFLLLTRLFRRSIFRKGFWRIKRHNNFLYTVCLILFSVGLIIDFLLYVNHKDSNDVFVINLLCGSWFFFFFLRGFKMFSYYTVIFHTIILGDLVRFGLIICIEFTAFTFAMYIILTGHDSVEEFNTFENTTLTMFGYMLGLKDLDLLRDVDLETQRLVAVIYIIFIIVTYLILLNSLIAMMTRTSSASHVEQKLMTLLQRSSVSLFFDGVVFFYNTVYDKAVGRSAVGDYRLVENRFYMAMKKEQMRKIMSSKQIQENVTLKDLKYELCKLAKEIERKNKGNNAEKSDDKSQSNKAMEIDDKSQSNKATEIDDKSQSNKATEIDDKSQSNKSMESPKKEEKIVKQRKSCEKSEVHLDIYDLN
ncbi:transient receptor potential cation channel subfamily V member 6 [Biomphalaria glabrata]|uniref:Transient receptor potential cation channel subfamily V member 6-like n=1 Tax=Biomphalaria glabrata TaxID=6526 RepID=A0A9U8EK99_BIOGL|nr:transient receptor potential cation channel subfamily V member 6-like [Biomphalaria glabrata]KAI8748840.1 transient receptor potential cation channel subfamily V member 6-like [Biomphalaria glabrata]